MNKGVGVGLDDKLHSEVSQEDKRGRQEVDVVGEGEHGA